LICSTVVALAGLVVDERPPQRVDAAPETGPTASATPAQRCAVFGDEHSTIRWFGPLRGWAVRTFTTRTAR